MRNENRQISAARLIRTQEHARLDELDAATPVEQMTIGQLQALCGHTAASKGFHDNYPDRADYVPGERGDKAHANSVLDWHGNKMMLIVSEVAEGHDEIRSGHAPTETYYVDSEGEDWPRQAYSAGIDAAHSVPIYKPEGVPSEIADIIVRALDYCFINNIDAAAIIAEKLQFNATRPALHGKKF